MREKHKNIPTGSVQMARMYIQCAGQGWISLDKPHSTAWIQTSCIRLDCQGQSHRAGMQDAVEEVVGEEEVEVSGEVVGGSC